MEQAIAPWNLRHARNIQAERAPASHLAGSQTLFPLGWVAGDSPRSEPVGVISNRRLPFPFPLPFPLPTDQRPRDANGRPDSFRSHVLVPHSAFSPREGRLLTDPPELAGA